MRYIVIISTLLCLAVCSKAQSWQWAVNSNQVGEARAADVATDKWGNVYVTGYFTGQLSIDTFNLTSAGAEDIFVAKYSYTGQLIWAKRFGGTGEDLGTSIVTDTMGNLYLAGSFSNTIVFDTTTLISKGASDVYTCCLSTYAEIQWIKTGGGAGVDYVSGGIHGSSGGIMIDKSGNLFVVGTFYDTARFDTIKIKGFQNIFETFIIKYSNSGMLVFAKSTSGGQGTEGALGLNVASCPNNEFAISGFCNQNSSYFDSTKLPIISYGNVSGNGFIARYDSNGKLKWLKGTGGLNSNSGSGNTGFVSGGSCAVDNQGNVFTMGSFSQCILRFENGPTFNPVGYSDAFVVKYNTNGVLRWAKLITGYVYDRGLTTDAEGNVYVTGSNGDAFIIKYDSTGNILWTTSAGGTGMDFGVKLALDTSNNVYCTGFFNSQQCSFGNQNIYNNASNFDMYVAKLCQPPTAVAELSTTTSQLTIYPNPSSGSFYLSYTNGNYTSLTITDAVGKTIMTQSLPHHQNKHQISLTHLADGLYFLRLQGNGNVATGKVWIKK